MSRALRDFSLRSFEDAGQSLSPVRLRDIAKLMQYDTITAAHIDMACDQKPSDCTVQTDAADRCTTNYIYIILDFMVRC